MLEKKKRKKGERYIKKERKKREGERDIKKGEKGRRREWERTLGTIELSFP